MLLNCILRIVFCIALYVLFILSVIVLVYLLGHYYYDSIVRSCDL